MPDTAPAWLLLATIKAPQDAATHVKLVNAPLWHVTEPLPV